MSPPRPISLPKKLGFTLAALALALVGLEGFARCYYWTRSLNEPPRAPAVVRRFHPLRYELRPGAVVPVNGAKASINALGLRGPEPALDDGRARVLCVGDSCTFGYAPDVSDEKTYPAQLSQLLETDCPGRFSVLNGGMPGFGSLDCLSFFVHRGEELHPDVVVILAGWNDNHQVQDLGRPQEWRWESMTRASALMRLMTGGLHRLGGLFPVVESDDLLRLQARHLPPMTGRISDSAFDRLRRSLEAMVVLARDQGAVPVLVTYANIARPDWTSSTSSLTNEELRRMIPHLAARRLSPEGWYQFASRTNAVIAYVARRRHVPLVDGASIRSPRVFVDVCHLNAEGNALLARKVEKTVLRLSPDGATGLKPVRTTNHQSGR